MADQAFALSPINAHGASPTDADYDAISEAFMETARGRWFLGEFARRNRSADTAMVLDAVARIERSIAAQKAPPSDELSITLAAVKTVVTGARAALADALDAGALDHTLAPHRKSARVIREIAWGLRESGADVRICDLLDGQVQAINAACDAFAAFPMRVAALQAIDTALADIDRIAAGDIPGPAVETPATEASATTEEPAGANAAMALADAPLPEPEAPPQDKPVAETEPEQAVTAQPPEAPEPPAAAIEMAPEAPLAVAETAEAEVALTIPDTASEPEVMIEPEARTEPETMAEPEAVAAPAPGPAEPVLAEAVPETPADDLAEVSEPEPELADALAHEIFAEPAAPEPAPRHQTVLAQVELMPVTESGPVAELPGPADQSLGASLIASGIVPKPAAPKPDPLAPIRRMTQIEKIALFS